MKKCLIVSISLFISSQAFCQLEFKNSNNGRLMNFEDLNGHSLLKKYDPDIIGSPFLIDDWSLAKLTLHKGKLIGPVLVKLNLENNELSYKDSTGKEMIVMEDIVKRIDFISSNNSDSIYLSFVNGYPAVDKQSQTFFYQVLTEGEVDFLFKKSKHVETEKHMLTGEIKKEFTETAPLYYVYVNKSMQILHNNKEFILEILKDKRDSIALFINNNKINCKKVSDLIKIFKYYNSI